MSPLLRRVKPSSTRRRGVHPLLVAGIVIALVVFVTYYAFSQQLPFTHQFTIHALVNNSVNVRADSPVRIAGIDVGSVEGTSPRGRQTEIDFTLEENGRPIHTDATVTIRDRLFLEGGYYLQLDPGTPGTPIARDGYTIPASQTSSPVQFFKLLSTFDVATRASLEHTLNTLNAGFSQQPGQPISASGAAGLKRAIPILTPVAEQTAWFTRALQGTRPGDVATLLQSASSVADTLAGNTASVTGLVDGLNTTAGALDATDGALGQSIDELDRTLRVAPRALSSIDHALPPVAKLAGVLAPSLRLAPPILDGVTTAVRALAAVVAPAERGRLLIALKATFQRLPSLLTKLGQVFPITKQVTDCLRTHVTPILDSVVPDANLSSGRPVWQDFIHFLPGVASAAQNFDGNGYWVRLLVGVGTHSFSLGNLPGIGQLVGDTPSNSPINGVRPVWQGDLTSDAFHPEVPCATDQLPSLASNGAAPDARAIDSRSR